MSKKVKDLTEVELRQIIREEITAALNTDPARVSGTDQELFINTDQAAAFIGLKKTSLYNLVHQNKIPFHKTGKRVLFKMSELSTWVNENGGEK